MGRRIPLAFFVLVALALPTDAYAQSVGAGETPGTSRNLSLVGHEPLFNLASSASGSSGRSCAYGARSRAAP